MSTTDLLNDSHVRQLESVLQGRVIRPTDTDYDEVRAVWNGMIDKYPALIVRCKAVTDVIETVNFARDHALPLSVRGGGHNVAGSAIAENGVVVDLSEMNNVSVDPVERVARVEGGARLGDLDRTTQPHGLVVPAGVVSDTGVAGLTLGGGLGWVRREYGLTIDSLLSATVVTADGRLVKASETENPDLFWGIRGGGGGLGVVSSFEFRLHPLGPDVMTVVAFYRSEDAPVVLRRYLEYTSTAPDAVSSFSVQGVVPAIDMFPAEEHGKQFLLLQACYAGSPEDGERIMQPLREFATPFADFSGVMPFTELQMFWDEDYPSGELRYYWRGTYLNNLDDEAIERLIKLAAEAPSALTTLDLWHLGGAISRVGEHETAYGSRNAQFLLGIEANWVDPQDDEANVAWARQAVSEMQSFSDGSQYANFPGLLEDYDRLFGMNYQRLTEIKAKYDPGHLFRLK